MANISPEQCQWIYSVLNRGDNDFNFNQEKIIASVRENGVSPVTKLTIARATVGSDGQKRNYPWYIKIENGTGIPAVTTTGGTMIQKNSYKMEKTAFINLNDMDMFCMLHSTISFINVWEIKHGCELLRQSQAS